MSRLYHNVRRGIGIQRSLVGASMVERRRRAIVHSRMRRRIPVLRHVGRRIPHRRRVVISVRRNWRRRSKPWRRPCMR